MNSRGWCARGVFNSLQAAGLRITRSASAYMAARTLAHDKRFREVRLTDAQTSKLPPGAIIVSGPYNHPGNPHGHIAVTLALPLVAPVRLPVSPGGVPEARPAFLAVSVA